MYMYQMIDDLPKSIIRPICEFAQSHRPHIALWLMMYGMGLGMYQWFAATTYDELLYDSIVHVPTMKTPMGLIHLMGFAQLSAYMAVDTVGNWLSPKPRAEIYIHHGVCGVGLISSFVLGLTWPPLFFFGTLECITVCRFIDDTKQELLFCWARIFCTLFIRVPIVVGVAYWAYTYIELCNFNMSSPMVRLHCVWGIIGASVFPFDCYLMTFYVKRLMAIRRKRVKHN